MKKIVALFFIFCLPFFFTGCEKDKTEKQKDLTSIEDHGTLKIGVTWSFTFKAGHNPTQCGNCCCSCMHSVFPSPCCHVPCWAFGSLCTHTITISLNVFDEGGGVGTSSQKIEFNKLYNGSVELAEEEGYEQLLMPARSSFDKEKGYWVNVPEQYFINNGDNVNFKMDRGVIFTKNKPMFNNEI